MTPLHTQGYERDGAQHIQIWDAVRWWYVHLEDGYTFARGGRARTAHDARDAIRNARNEHERDALRSNRLSKLTHRLGPQGELIPLRKVSNG